MKIAIRVDAHAAIGMGHLSRCVTLAEQLVAAGAEVTLVCTARSRIAVSLAVVPAPVVWLASDVETDASLDAEATLATLGNAAEHAWIIVDHYGLDAPWEHSMREHGYRILAIDDFRNRPHCADILVSDTEAPFDITSGCCALDIIVLAGPMYAIIDAAFAPALPTDAAGDRAGRILISYGSGDPTGETMKALDAIELLQQRSARVTGVDVVVGPLNGASQDIVRRASSLRDVRVHSAPRSLAPLLRTAALLMTAAGHSMLEALTMGRPCLVTQTADNQAIGMARLTAMHAIVAAGNHSDVQASALAAMIEDLMASPGPSCALFDGRGAQRIVHALMSTSPTVIPVTR